MEIFTQQGGEILSRWGHYLSGVTWIGLLYYYNFVQAPALVQMDGPVRIEVLRKISVRAMWWFRYAAALTVLTGLSITVFSPVYRIDGFWRSASGYSISTGILLALVMFTNVWLVIWPNSKVVFASAEGVAAGREPDPAAASAARRGLLASRTNTVMSIPMLFFMGATGHFAPFFGAADGGGRASYLLIVLLLVALLEANALGRSKAPGPATVYLDTHRGAIIAGFVLTLVLYLLFELVFGS